MPNFPSNGSISCSHFGPFQGSQNLRYSYVWYFFFLLQFNQLTHLSYNFFFSLLFSIVNVFLYLLFGKLFIFSRRRSNTFNHFLLPGFPEPAVKWYLGTMKLVPTNNIVIVTTGRRNKITFLRLQDSGNKLMQPLFQVQIQRVFD